MSLIDRRLFTIAGVGSLLSAVAGKAQGAKLAVAPDTDAVIAAMRAGAKPTLLLEEGASGSKLGGLPHLLESVAWPERRGKPLAFLAELDLRDLRAAGGPDWLPADGVLFFFYDTQEQPWGFDPDDRDGWVVVHGQRAQVVRSAPPESPPESLLDEKSVKPRAATSYPDPQRLSPELARADYDFDAVYDLMKKDFGRGPEHRVGGYPSPIQNDRMELEAQLASNGIYVGGPEGYATSEAKQLESGASDWRLLLQLDSDDDAGMMWGDLGKLYFWIREADARAADFSKVWLVLQCS